MRDACAPSVGAARPVMIEGFEPRTGELDRGLLVLTFTTPLNPRLISVLIAGVVAWRSKNMVYTLLAGMAVLWAFTLLGIG